MGVVGTRMTKQKSLILDLVKGTKCHPTADWVYQEARQQIPDISLGTVYRNLNALANQGMIREMNYAGTSSRYDGDVSQHYHFVCQDCGFVYDLPLEPLKAIDDLVENQENHKVAGHRLEFYGRCKSCKIQEKQ
ncbi:Fur family transcriptional regulator [Heliorestis convoluta]|uniref:Ferric uptake regulator, Fur family n=1 Tax=Heliorestis convoluta TaxID=356322 RepID=A0A5Q2MYM2_9FIRM|nr:transcriptional repressor [Heliorestis convoluta]QGG47838.1 ferric uptake regulator, Fur family [Heliorestis convoluta]